MLKAISNLAFWNWSSLGKENQIANCGLKSTSLCISLLISPRGLTSSLHRSGTSQMSCQPSPRWWWFPPCLLSQHRLPRLFLIQHSCPEGIRKAPPDFLERRIASVCVFQAVSLFVILPMLIVIQLLCSDPGSFSPLTEKASVLWCKPFLWNCCKVL